MGPGEQYRPVLANDISCRQRKPPTGVPIHQRDIHQDAAVVLLLRGSDGIRQPELGSQAATGVREHREGEPMLHGGEVVLTNRLRRNPNQQRPAFSNRGIQISPRLKFSHAIRDTTGHEKS